MVVAMVNLSFLYLEVLHKLVQCKATTHFPSQVQQLPYTPISIVSVGILVSTRACHLNIFGMFSCESWVRFPDRGIVTLTRTPVNSRNGLIPKMGVLSGRHFAVSVRIVPGLPQNSKICPGWWIWGFFSKNPSGSTDLAIPGRKKRPR